MSRYAEVSQRTYGILIVSVIILFFHMVANPFKEASDNMLESLSLLMLVFAASTKSAFPNGGESSSISWVPNVRNCSN